MAQDAGSQNTVFDSQDNSTSVNTPGVHNGGQVSATQSGGNAQTGAADSMGGMGVTNIADVAPAGAAGASPAAVGDAGGGM